MPQAEAEIAELEIQLRDAMLHSDVATLDRLIAPELMFTDHFGRVLGKADDLALHCNGTLRFSQLVPSEQQIMLRGDAALVTVRMHTVGSFADAPFDSDLRYTRIWHRGPAGWQLVGGHISAIQQLPG
ncbi:protein of unknown function [Andreprevotia lacus DSM 23236]|jgi:ketosteroid isomerase-like protein|uniref:DUF4440 domain-containing protein n=1 Tax=Andreprevotia lacus DSM 23236 TaxID=1121001 RepID=A0A1W1XG46_9NEIS|nr:nuclear transport factor 2 family protein [Andreprevotia lacus]SMC22807.1 protein of unknown function [Andreprevotia lacus DSM 23236]